MPAEKGKNEVQEVEVERLPPGEGERRPPGAEPRQGVRQVAQAMGPIVAGLLIDAIDVATLTPPLGVALGVPLGLFVAHQLKLRGAAAWQFAALAGLYCAVPGTHFLPLGTLVGVYTRLRQLLKNGS